MIPGPGRSAGGGGAAPGTLSRGSVGLTARQRASTALHGTSMLSGRELLTIVKSAAQSVKGGGASLLTTGVRNLGAQVNVESESALGMHLSITSGKRLVALCTFSVNVWSQDGRTSFKVGGLDEYKTQQSKVLVFIPAGPKQIPGMSPYKRFLDLAGNLILQADPTAVAQISGAS
jgi:hypothetical protein